MEKIYSLAQSRINSQESLLRVRTDFPTEEVAKCAAIFVEDFLVIFRIHTIVKEMIEKILPLVLDKATIEFDPADENYWNTTIRANGAESYYFARLLTIAVEFHVNKKIDIIKTTREFIEAVTQEAILIAKGEAEIIFQIEACYDGEKYTYKVGVPMTDGTWLTMSNQDPNLLCRYIGLYIKENLREKNED